MNRITDSIKHAAHICQHDGCWERHTITCQLQHPARQTPDYYYYCAKHIQDGGFCLGCGAFCAGIESFDFSPVGLCDSCRAELDDDWSDAEDYD